MGRSRSRHDRFAPAARRVRADAVDRRHTLRAGGVEDPSAELIAALEARDAAWAARVADSHAAAERRALGSLSEGGAKRRAGADQSMATHVASAGVYRRVGAERMGVFHCAFDEAGARLACAGGGKEVGERASLSLSLPPSLSLSLRPVAAPPSRLDCVER